MMQALVELNLHRKGISPLKSLAWTSLVFQGLGPHPFTAQSVRSSPGQGTKISHARRPKIKINKKFLFVLDIMPCEVITYLPNQFWDSVYLFKHVIILMMTLCWAMFVYIWGNEILSILHYSSLFHLVFVLCGSYQHSTYACCLFSLH